MKETDPPPELTRMLRETFSELRREAQKTPLDLQIPPIVTQSLETYTKTYAVDPARLIPLAMEAHFDRLDLVGEEVCRLMEHPGSFDWPLENPILCVAIAFMRKLTDRWVDKVQGKYGLSDEELDPADWWKTIS